MVTPSQFEFLRSIDTPTVCNLLEIVAPERRGFGYTVRHLHCPFPNLPPMVGFAVTATFRSMQPPRGGDAYTGMKDQVEAFAQVPGPPVMVFQDLDQPCVSATFGEVMCSTYKKFGAEGLITSGTGRDLAQVEALGFPVFTNGAMAAHGYCHILTVNTPVTVGGMTIYPGDLLHGDRNGVTTIPIEIASEVPDACDEVAAAEKIILDYVKGSNLNAKDFAEARKACGAKIQELSKRLKTKYASR